MSDLTAGLNPSGGLSRRGLGQGSGKDRQTHCPRCQRTGPSERKTNTVDTPEQKRNQSSNTSAPTHPHEWNFDAVKDWELVACCYWEYARESAFIRDVRQRCLEFRKRGSLPGADPQLWDATDKLQSIGYPSEVFLRGFFFEPGVEYQSANEKAPHYRYPSYHLTGSFPDPWQSLSDIERNARARIRSDLEECRIVPVKIGHWSFTKDITRYCQARADRQDETHRQWERDYMRGGKVVKGAPAPPHFEEIRPGLFIGNGESLLVEIAWEHFTDDEIARYFRRWVKDARPKTIPKPDDKGRKVISWRVALERLGIVRLLHRFPLRELSTECPAAWKRYSNANRRWRRDAEKARGFFRRLFPFLPAAGDPISWPPKDYAQPPA